MKIFVIILVIMEALIITLSIVAIRNDLGETKTSIWNTAVSPGPLSAAHASLNNKCETCHTPNQGIVAAKCITCHASTPELLMNPVTSFHANLSDCRGCHTEHLGNKVRPIHMNHAALERIALKHHSGPHWQATQNAASLNCQSCHAFQDKHHEFFGKQCAACHTTNSWKIPGYLHPSPTSTNCSECHKAPPSHRMMHFEMVDQFVTHEEGARFDQCYMCHKTDSFNDIKGVGWYKMH